MTHRQGTWGALAMLWLVGGAACTGEEAPDAAAGHGADAAGSGGSGGPGGGAGGSAGHGGMDALDEKCTPTVTLQLEDTGPSGAVFTDAIAEPEPFAQQTGRTVCRILYRTPDEVRDANHLTLIIRNDPEYPGWKAGDVGDITVMISTYFLAQLAENGGDVAAEVRGILLHEMTHMYQNDDKAPGEGSYVNLPNVVEGVADFVRIRAGFTPAGAYASKQGEWDDEGYWKPAFFLLWIDGQVPDFLHDMNLSMAAGDGEAWSPDRIETITGTSVADWWAAYATASCCAGQTLDCCGGSG